MANNFHVNPESGEYGTCSASVRLCIYQSGSGENHFDTENEAKVAAEKILQSKYSQFSRRTKNDNRSKSTKFAKDFENMKPEEVKSFVNHSKANYEIASGVVADRIKNIPQKYKNVEKLNPNNQDNENSCHYSTYELMKDKLNDYNRATDDLSEALVDSKYFHLTTN